MRVCPGLCKTTGPGSSADQVALAAATLIQVAPERVLVERAQTMQSVGVG